MLVGVPANVPVPCWKAPACCKYGAYDPIP